MNRMRIFLFLGGVSVMCALLIRCDRRITFENVQEAQTSIEAAGYSCVGDRADGKTLNGFVVSRTPITWETANDLRKAGPMGAQWNGKAWIVRNSVEFPLATSPGDTAPRVWGDVLAFGDREFLDEIEGSLRM